GGGGGGGIPIDLLILLLIQYPALGVPVLICVIAVVVVRASMQSGSSSVREVGHGAPRPRARRPSRQRAAGGLDRLRREDPGFSLPVLQDYLVMLFQRVDGAVGRGGWDALAPFVSAAARESVERGWAGVQRIDETVVGAVKLMKVQHGATTRVHVSFAATRVLVRADGSSQRMYSEETWVLQRAGGAVSLAPEAMLRMGCPSCGAAIETDLHGACTNCGTAITKGQLQWQLESRTLVKSQPVSAPKVGFFAGGDEPSVGMPTVVDPQLPAEVRKLRGRHPEFDLEQFHQRVTTTYFELQGAWSAGRYQNIRPYVTDPMYQSLRFWVEKYTASGLRNQLTDVRLSKAMLVKVELDAWYESITVRIWGSMKDATVDRAGTVVGGNAKTDRRFSEYWTFLRAAGGEATSHPEKSCPSCGAALDAVDQAGVCGYCDTKITSGHFDWVLSRIDQAEVYGG
ncbi:MAG: hypothetical protein ACI8PZ_007382, partial [Myxococcota bacterium]